MRVTPRVLPDGSADVQVSARTTGGRTVFELEGEKLEGSEGAFHIKQPVLWHGRKQPHLYTLTASLYDGDTLTDQMKIPFGIRSFRIDPNEGFILNGESYPLRGVAMHQDWLGKGNAISEEDMENSLRHVYEMGATTVRLAHYQHDQHTYDLCDQMGLVVWTEIPYISEHMDNARDNARQQMMELIEQNYNHPSIVVYSNLPEVSLTVNGTEYKKQCPDHFFHFTVPQPEGAYTVVASAGALCEQAQFNHVAQPDSAYRFQQGTVLNWFDIACPKGYYSIKDLLKDIALSSDAMALVQPFLAEMMASRAEKAKQKEQETGRKTQKSGEGMSEEARRNTTMQFSLLQLIRMAAPDMPKDQIIEMNQKLNRIPKTAV